MTVTEYTMSSEAAVSYASLILADAEIEITADKLLALTKAAGLDVEPVSFDTKTPTKCWELSLENRHAG